MQPATQPAIGCRTADDFREALEALDDLSWYRVRGIARALAQGGGLDGEDLLHEAVLLVLEGGRIWPGDVSLIPFLRGVMRSVVSGETKWRGKSGIRTPRSLFADDGRMACEPGDDRPDPEAALSVAEEATRTLAEVEALFEGNEAAGLILMGLCDGKDGEELRKETGLAKTEFASARRLVRRKLNGFRNGRARP